MRWCFFDRDIGILRRYPAGVARALHHLDPAAEFVFLYYESVKHFAEVGFPNGARLRFVPNPAAEAVLEILRQERPDALIVTAQRLPDSVYVTAAKQLGIPTIMFQHGLYTRFMRRESAFFLSNLAKTIQFARYAAALGRLHGRSPIRYVGEMAKVFVFGKPYADAAVDHSALNVDLVLLNGEYWREFHHQQYRYPAESQKVVGYPDYAQLDDIEARQPVRGVCYITQTLVEDGRLSKERFGDFLDVLLSSLDGMTLYLKLHPRSERAIYREIAGRPDVVLTEELPRATGYVGHYSTYLALIPFITSNLFLWELDGHPIPPFLREAAAVVSSEPWELRQFIERLEPRGPSSEVLRRHERYFWRNTSGTPFAQAAQEILALARGRLRK